MLYAPKIHQVPSRDQLLAVAPIIVCLCYLPASAQDELFLQAAPAPAPAANGNTAPQPADLQRLTKPAVNVAKPRAVAIAPLNRPVLIPAVYPNPLAFNINWLAIKPMEAMVAERSLVIQRRLAEQRGAIAGRAPPNAFARNAIEQQMRRTLEPALKTELSFVSRAADLNPAQRQKLIADCKAWFYKYLSGLVKNSNTNQQQMLMQGQQGVWFGGRQPQRVTDPRDAIRDGVAKIVASTLPKEKATAYATECRKRDEFARQVTVENLVERIDEKVKLSPEQWQNLTKSLNDHWDKGSMPQLEAFAINTSMWPGAPDQLVLPELSPAQQGILTRINRMSGRVFFGGGGIMGPMFAGDGEVIDDIDLSVAQPAAAVVPESPFAE